jgi:hypothetical protein
MPAKVASKATEKAVKGDEGRQARGFAKPKTIVDVSMLLSPFRLDYS